MEEKNNVVNYSEIQKLRIYADDLELIGKFASDLKSYLDKLDVLDYVSLKKSGSVIFILKNNLNDDSMRVELNTKIKSVLIKSIKKQQHKDRFSIDWYNNKSGFITHCYVDWLQPKYALSNGFNGMDIK